MAWWVSTRLSRMRYRFDSRSGTYMHDLKILISDTNDTGKPSVGSGRSHSGCEFRSDLDESLIFSNVLSSRI